MLFHDNGDGTLSHRGLYGDPLLFIPDQMPPLVVSRDKRLDLPAEAAKGGVPSAERKAPSPAANPPLALDYPPRTFLEDVTGRPYSMWESKAFRHEIHTIDANKLLISRTYRQ